MTNTFAESAFEKVVPDWPEAIGWHCANDPEATSDKLAAMGNKRWTIK